uniref:DUF288 domain-containing protein n=1 Tax=Plectus sambesii TaxID=2011161 RepID=A0A914WVD5_9BILA
MQQIVTSGQFDKWIVVTTINYPTDAVKALAEQTGWRVVIVADKKTPTDWSLAGCDFLSIDMQKQLNFAVSSLIPYNSYTRKMIGYLYAIQNGAQWIYDTDDDNQPVDVGIKLFDTQSTVSGLSYGEECYPDCNSTRSLFNAYAFWGQPDIWPRGYPLEEVRKVNNETQYTLCKTQKVPAIQQGLVLQDPDVDAVYRLLNADEVTGLDVYFNKHAPPIILNPGTFCPFNSQNTLFHYNALWSLFLPVSVAFRVTDIWRGYFAQKLLHLTGNRLGFYPVNAIQKRNSHSYLADFKDETQLYVDAGKMVEFISKWTCEHNLFKECIQQLSSEFLENKFWGEADVTLLIYKMTRAKKKNSTTQTTVEVLRYSFQSKMINQVRFEKLMMT